MSGVNSYFSIYSRVLSSHLPCSLLWYKHVHVLSWEVVFFSAPDVSIPISYFSSQEFLTFGILLASSCVTWFLSWSFLLLPLILAPPWHPPFSYKQSVLVFLCDRSTLCSMCHCWFEHCFMHLVFQIDGYLLPICLHCCNAIMSTVVFSTTAVMAMSEPTREYECCQLKETSITMSGGIQKCYDQGQRLINVKTVAQNNAIMGQVTSSFSKYWIGIYKSDKGTSLVSESMTINHISVTASCKYVGNGPGYTRDFEPVCQNVACRH